jgi:hypothetical protein
MDAEGRVLDIYEQTTLSTDDGYTTDKTFHPALTVEDCIRISAGQIDAAVERFHTVYQPYFHPIRTRPGPLSTQRWLEATLDYAAGRGLHFVDGERWVTFNDARRVLRLVEYHFDPAGTALDLALAAEGAVAGATVTLPATFQGRLLTGAEVDCEPVAVCPRVLEGRSQVLLPADYAAGQTRRWHLRWA